METRGCFLLPGELPSGPSLLACGYSQWEVKRWCPISPRPRGCGFAKGKVLSAWSVTECVKCWNKMTFHSNLVVSGVFINKGASLLLSLHHLYADIILHHTSACGLTCPLLIHCFPFAALGAQRSATCLERAISSLLWRAGSWQHSHQSQDDV